MLKVIEVRCRFIWDYITTKSKLILDKIPSLKSIFNATFDLDALRMDLKLILE